MNALMTQEMAAAGVEVPEASAAPAGVEFHRRAASSQRRRRGVRRDQTTGDAAAAPQGGEWAQAVDDGGLAGSATRLRRTAQASPQRVVSVARAAARQQRRLRRNGAPQDKADQSEADGQQLVPGSAEWLARYNRRPGELEGGGDGAGQPTQNTGRRLPASPVTRRRKRSPTNDAGAEAATNANPPVAHGDGAAAVAAAASAFDDATAAAAAAGEAAAAAATTVEDGKIAVKAMEDGLKEMEDGDEKTEAAAALQAAQEQLAGSIVEEKQAKKEETTLKKEAAKAEKAKLKSEKEALKQAKKGAPKKVANVESSEPGVAGAAGGNAADGDGASTSLVETTSVTAPAVLQTSPEELRIQQAWKKADADGSGALDRAELKAVLVSMGFNAGQIDIERVFSQVDTDGSGAVEYGEFRIWFLGQESAAQQMYYEDYDSGPDSDDDEMASPAAEVQSSPEEFQIQQAWKKADADGSGALDRAELKAVLVSMGFNKRGN